MMHRINIFFLVFLFFPLSVMAQSERKITRKGNSLYETGNFVDAEIKYKKALEKNASLLEAQFNLGDALVKQQRYDEALESFENVSMSSDNKKLKAKAHFNKGNVLLAQKDLEGALESYKESLRIDPKDDESRYNYAFVKKQLDQQQEQQEDQDQNSQENNEDGENDKSSDDSKNEDQQEGSESKDQEDSGENENEEDKNQDDQDNRGETDGDDNDEDKEGQSPKPSENKLSPKEAQRLLDALNQQEDQVQEKMKKHKLKGAQLKIDKDW